MDLFELYPIVQLSFCQDKWEVSVAVNMVMDALDTASLSKRLFGLSCFGVLEASIVTFLGGLGKHIGMDGWRSKVRRLELYGFPVWLWIVTARWWLACVCSKYDDHNSSIHTIPMFPH
jgi:hypothetical protein